MHDNILASIGSPKAPILVQLSEYAGRRSLDIRRFFTSAKDGELYATKKGISLNAEAFRVLLNVIAAESTRISDWLDGASHAEEETVTTLVLRREAREEARTGPRPSASSSGAWQSPAFFRVAYDGHKDTLTLNTGHPVGSMLAMAKSATNPDVVALLDAVLAVLTSYSRSRELFSGVGTMEVDALFDDLEFNWGLILERQLANRKAP